MIAKLLCGNMVVWEFNLFPHRPGDGNIIKDGARYELLDVIDNVAYYGLKAGESTDDFCDDDLPFGNA